MFDSSSGLAELIVESQAVAVLDAQRFLLYVSRRFSEWLGCPVEQVVGKAPPELWPEEAAQRLELCEAEALAHGSCDAVLTINEEILITHHRLIGDKMIAFWLEPMTQSRPAQD